MVGEDGKGRRPKITAKSFDAPDDAPGFEVEGRPMAFVVEGGAADEDDGPNGAVRLFLLQGGAETVDAGIAV